MLAAIETAARDTGKTIEEGSQDTGKTLEKAGQDIGNAVEGAVRPRQACRAEADRAKAGCLARELRLGKPSQNIEINPMQSNGGR